MRSERKNCTLIGGESEIRTRGPVKADSLVNCWFKPLIHLSVEMRILRFASILNSQRIPPTAESIYKGRSSVKNVDIFFKLMF